MTHSFPSARSPCCSESRTYSGERRFAPGDSVNKGISRLSMAKVPDTKRQNFKFGKGSEVT